MSVSSSSSAATASTRPRDTAAFFSRGSAQQFQFVLELYPSVLRLRAQLKSKKPLELIKLDEWYQNELPQKIKSRGKDAHVTHDELVQTMKWKLARGKFYPQLSNLVKINTPKAVLAESRKAFRKLPNLEQAITALNNLKGVGTTMASALLAAACPEKAPFMADECLMAIPDIEGIDYTTKEYLNFMQHIRGTVDRLNREDILSKDNSAAAEDGASATAVEVKTWSAHKVELALWTHFVASDLKPTMLDDMPGTSLPSGNSSHSNLSPSGPTENGDVAPAKNGEPCKHAADVEESDSTTNDSVGGAADSLEGGGGGRPPPSSTTPTTRPPQQQPLLTAQEDTTDSSSSLGISEESSSRGAAALDEASLLEEEEEDDDDQPVSKKTRLEVRGAAPPSLAPPPVAPDDNALQA